MLIGLTGKTGVGKTTAAKHLVEEHYFVAYSFSGLLKGTVSNLFGIPLAWLYDSNKKEQVLPEWNKTPRKILQIFGTECMRNHFGKDFWIKSVKKNIKYSFFCGLDVVIDDVRFPEEAEMIISNGGKLIQVTRSNNPYVTKENQQHISEHALSIPIRFIIHNNSTIETFHTNVDEILKILSESGGNKWIRSEKF